VRIGIDFGTYRSSAAYLKNGVPELIEQPFSRLSSLPSTVFLAGDGVLTAGQMAEGSFREEPGRGFRHPKRALWEGSPVPFGGRAVTPHEMVVAVLKTMRNAAESAMGQAPDAALLTVPASAPEQFRLALIGAAHDAGFTHVELISTPLAAAAYAAYKGSPAEGDTILVYVLGGGGFDAGLLRCEQGVYQPVTDLVGTEHGGGLDFDRQIYFDLLHRCPTAAPLLAADRDDAIALRARLSVADFCRSLKERLSDVEAAGDLLVLPGIAPERYAMTREHFNELIAPYVAQSLELCRAMIAGAGIEIHHIRGVLLVGGSARVPLVRTLVPRELGLAAIIVDEPELVFSQGAALYDDHSHNAMTRDRRQPARIVASVPPSGTEAEPHAAGERDDEVQAPDSESDPESTETVAPPVATAGTSEPIVLPDLVGQGMVLRLAPGRVRTLHSIGDDGLLVITAGGAALLDVMTGEPRWEVDYPTGAGALSPDGEIVALAGPHDLLFWRLATRSVEARTQGTRPAVRETPIDISTVVRSALDDRHSPEEQEQLRDQREYEERRTDGVTSMAFNPNGTLLATGRHQHELVLGARGLALWQTGDGTQDPRLQKNALQVTAVAFSADGRYLAAATVGAKAHVWEVSSGRHLHELRHGMSVLCVAFSPDGQLLATSSVDKQAALWDVATGTRQSLLEGHSHPVTCLAFSPDGQLLATGSRDRTIRLWNAVDGREIGVFEALTMAPTALTFSLDSRQLVIAGGDDSITVWEVLRRRRARTLARGAERVTHISFETPAGARGAGTRHWPVTIDGVRYVLRGGTAPFDDPSASIDGRYRAEGGTGGDNTVKLWVGGAHQAPRRLAGHAGEVSCVVFNDACTILASAGADTKIRLWALPDGLALGSYTGHEGPISALRFSPDGRYLASGGEDGSFRVWELASGKCMVHHAGHAGPVTLLTFSPDGRLLATGGGDHAVHIWGFKEGWAPRRLEGHSEKPTSLAFSADARLLATAGAAGTVRVWRV
jgi:WD40 repeat protein